MLILKWNRDKNVGWKKYKYYTSTSSILQGTYYSHADECQSIRPKLFQTHYYYYIIIFAVGMVLIFYCSGLKLKSIIKFQHKNSLGAAEDKLSE